MTLSRFEEQAERQDVLENEKRLRGAASQGSTYLDHTHNEVGGRFGKMGSPQTVGSTPIPKYEGKPNWAYDPVPDEPSLGYSINEMDTTGQPHELRASELKATLEPPSVPNPPSPPAATPNPASHAASSAGSSYRTPFAGGAGLDFSRAYRRA